MANPFAKNTIKNYESDWKNFFIWCESLNTNPLNITHSTFIAYITSSSNKAFCFYSMENLELVLKAVSTFSLSAAYTWIRYA